MRFAHFPHLMSQKRELSCWKKGKEVERERERERERENGKWELFRCGHEGKVKEKGLEWMREKPSGRQSFVSCFVCVLFK